MRGGLHAGYYPDTLGLGDSKHWSEVGGLGPCPQQDPGSRALVNGSEVWGEASQKLKAFRCIL